MNAAVAARVLVEAGVAAAADPDRLASAASGFAGLESRLRLVLAAGDVEFYDDSLSTNVLPTIAAVDAFPGRRVAVIVGGFDRGIDYEPLAEYLAARAAPTLALDAPGQRRPHRRAARGAGAERRGSTVRRVAGRRLAGFEWAKPAGVVLLSPAAPSFGQFRDYRERARAFVEAAKACARG